MGSIARLVLACFLFTPLAAAAQTAPAWEAARAEIIKDYARQQPGDKVLEVTGPEKREAILIAIRYYGSALVQRADGSKSRDKVLVEYRLVPAGALKRQVEAVALSAWRALGCRDGGRIDLRQDQQGRTHFIEVNPLAGLHPEHSDLPIMATMAGIGYEALITSIVQSAMERCGGLRLAKVRRAV